MTFQGRADPAPLQSARDAYAAALPGMSPAQRAEAEMALADMPSQRQMDAMQAELLHEAEEAVRTASSEEEARSAREGLQALRQSMGGVARQQTIHFTERWTLIGKTCAAGR